ncbi:Vegetative incompatibility protein HET-E-1 [Madurella mycetomatis]|uniref:Vegetative incompatibility protein HET-E-1 n=1 Tax=Madurella mycetomatis TaxID=100816 RepID=A0A175WGQ7_9PEZI|nr:Vegetative incompatibility protein HET-E-1 [Madurella mycetomatis]
MRLLSTRTLELDGFFDKEIPKYAILSHTWEKQEIVFRDMADLNKARLKAGFAKIEGTCALAASQGYDYVWIDTCCIDKSSSAELSEAINSMWAWYRDSAVCYAYLCDVEKPAELGTSRWFTRGWTLQELIAPSRVEFYSKTWDYLGEKQDSSLITAVFQASRVDECVLAGVISPHHVSVAKRMYWASKRATTRKEDEAYCLMGLFDVNMPLLYGEGPKSFIRLQNEIAKITNDQSILAWYCASDDASSLTSTSGCYAPSPRCFAMSGNISLLPLPAPAGFLPGSDLATKFRTVFLNDDDDPTAGRREKLAILYCQVGPMPGTFPTIALRPVAQIQSDSRYYIRIIREGSVQQFAMHDGDFLLDYDHRSFFQSLGLIIGQDGTLRGVSESG